MAGLMGVLGGTFDPPHLGHLILAAEACQQLGLQRLLWTLTPNPPHKLGQVITPLEHRLAMLQAALDDDPLFELSRVDVERSAPHYALDTVLLLRRQYPQARLAYLMGGDSLADLPTWHRAGEFVTASDVLAVMRRPGVAIDLSSLEMELPGLSARLRWIEAPQIEIASSDIRQRAASGQTFRYFLSPPVYAYICNNGLYPPQPAPPTPAPS